MMEEPREEWSGQRSHKWTTSRKHVTPPGIYGENVKEKIFSETYIEPPPNTGKKHFKEIISVPKEYKPSIKLINPQLGTLERITGMKKIVENFTIVKPKTERVHFRSKAGTERAEKPGMEKYRKTRHDYNTTAITTSTEKVEKIKDAAMCQKEMKWKEKVKLNALAEEKKAVGSLIEWEKKVAKQSDPNYYDPDEDEDDNEEY